MFQRTDSEVVALDDDQEQRQEARRDQRDARSSPASTTTAGRRRRRYAGPAHRAARQEGRRGLSPGRVGASCTPRERGVGASCTRQEHESTHLACRRSASRRILPADGGRVGAVVGHRTRRRPALHRVRPLAGVQERRQARELGPCVPVQRDRERPGEVEPPQRVEHAPPSHPAGREGVADPDAVVAVRHGEGQPDRDPQPPRQEAPRSGHQGAPPPPRRPSEVPVSDQLVHPDPVADVAPVLGPAPRRGTIGGCPATKPGSGRRRTPSMKSVISRAVIPATVISDTNVSTAGSLPRSQDPSTGPSSPPPEAMVIGVLGQSDAVAGPARTVTARPGLCRTGARSADSAVRSVQDAPTRRSAACKTRRLGPSARARRADLAPTGGGGAQTAYAASSPARSRWPGRRRPCPRRCAPSR